MTEEQAKTKWCPFVRAVTGTITDAGSAHHNQPAYNRVVEGSKWSFPQGAACIASACMSWRRLTVMIDRGTGEPHIPVGAGFVHHHSGARLTRSMAMESLSRHLADSLKPFITQADRDFANACVDQITEAMAASFPTTSEAPMAETKTTKSRRGFAAMTPERRRELARQGGGAVPAEKRSFARNSELAAAAGRKGGQKSRGGGRPAQKAAG